MGLWKKLWYACVPRKVNICVWGGCLDALPTRRKLKRRCILGVEECLVCGGQVETVEHEVRDCYFAATVWFSTLGLRVGEIGGMSLKDWVVQSPSSLPTLVFELMLMIIWSIWKTRNDLIWKGIQTAPREVSLKAEEWLASYTHCHRT